jgi:hypothetical protein
MPDTPTISHFLCLHGRSLRINLWGVEQLRGSNGNLHTGFNGIDRVPGGSNFIIPENLEGIRDCCIVLGNVTQRSQFTFDGEIFDVNGETNVTKNAMTQ